VRSRVGELLALDEEALLSAVAGEHRDRIIRELVAFDVDQARGLASGAGIEQICRCARRYPPRLLDLDNPPAVLHIAGDTRWFDLIVEQELVAVVGARRASSYGIEVARSLSLRLGVAGVPVLSGMALGIDSAAHRGALDGGHPTLAVLPGPAEKPYPRGKHKLHREIREQGAVISEIPPDTGVWRWMFTARNRIIAALAAMTVVVEAGEHSGSLVTARIARELGRPVGAVPGRITSPLAAGPNALLAHGARVVTGAQDVLDHLFGVGVRAGRHETRAALEPGLRDLLALIADGTDTAAALSRTGMSAEDGLAALAALELAGYVRRGPGGRFAVVP
jgi:DNA processing protein